MSNNNNVITLSSLPEVNDMLTETIRQGAQTLLSTAIELEVKQFIEKVADLSLKTAFFQKERCKRGLAKFL